MLTISIRFNSKVIEKEASEKETPDIFEEFRSRMRAYGP